MPSRGFLRWLATNPGSIGLLWGCWFLLTIPALAGELMLPEVYSGQVDVSGWLMSEKLDGVRGYWDGRQPAVKKRQGLVPAGGIRS